MTADRADLKYTVTTFCSGSKYQPVLPHWRRRVAGRCRHADIAVFTDRDAGAEILRTEYAWWDVARLEGSLAVMRATNAPVVHCDIDVIVEKDLAPLVRLGFDFLVSTEPGGYPTELSSKIGIGACTGFYVLQPSGAGFASELLRDMKSRRYGSYSDQIALMNRLAAGPARHGIDELVIGGRRYRNHVFDVDGARVCILDNGLVTRDPVRNEGQFANHVNIDNVGGTRRMIRYFYRSLDELPLTCRCGKLGDTRACVHIRHERDAWDARYGLGWRGRLRRLVAGCLPGA